VTRVILVVAVVVEVQVDQPKDVPEFVRGDGLLEPARRRKRR
jgi:hypothetical protein